MGSYMHGLFTADGFRAAYLTGLGGMAGNAGYDDTVEQALNALADHLERHLDLDALLSLAE
jgi:adenosylcobyric acid synthase